MGTDRKVIRRRRAVLIACVVASLGLLTASFGETSSSIERGALEVLGPIQEGAAKALTPVRDAAGWVGDTLDAKGEVEQLRAERDALRVRLAEAQDAVGENAQLRRALDMREKLGYADQGPRVARVISEPANVWSSKLIVDQGSRDGVRPGHPVMAAGGLVGRVEEVTGRQAVVQLITDQDAGIGARVQGTRVAGIVEPEVGDPDDLRLASVASVASVDEDQTVVTAGTTSERYPSDFPAGLPIGRIAEVDDDDRVHVRPFADVRQLEFVEVLTEPATP